MSWVIAAALVLLEGLLAREGAGEADAVRCFGAMTMILLISRWEGEVCREIEGVGLGN